INVPPEATAALKRDLAGGAGPLAGIGAMFELTAATLLIDVVGDAAQLELTGDYPSAVKASNGRKAVAGAKALLDLGLPTLVDQLKMGLPAAQAQALTETITGALDSFQMEVK